MNRAIKRLLQVEPKAMKALNKVFNIDWMQPYTAIEVKDNFTVNSIVKTIEATNNDLVIILTQDPNSYWYKKEFGIARIYANGKHDIEFDKRFYTTDCRNIRTYTRKSDFDDIRKKKEIYSIVIKQEKKYLTIDKEKSVDTSQRFKLSKAERAIDTHYTSDHTPYIDKISLIETTNNGQSFAYHVHSNWYNKPKTTNVNDIIDKSGYILENKRQELKRKAAILKAEREKAAFMATDNSAQVEELKKRISDKKAELIIRLSTAETSEMLEQVGKAIGEAWYKGFSRIVREFEKMQKGVIDKSYKSIDEFNEHYQEISNRLQEI